MNSMHQSLYAGIVNILHFFLLLWALFFVLISSRMCHEKSFSFHCTHQAERMINLNRGYMFCGLFSLGGSLNRWNISNDSKNTAFCSTFFTHLSTSFLPWLNLIPDLSLLSFFCLLLSSLSLIFLWISVVHPNPSVPLSCLFFPSVSSLCAFAHRWLRGVLAGFCFPCLVSIEYQLLSLVREACQCKKPASYTCTRT